MHLLGGHQRKALLQIKSHLVAEHAFGAGSGAIGLEHAMRIHMAHEVLVLRGRVGSGHGGAKVGSRRERAIVEVMAQALRCASRAAMGCA
jgi:hypothetical protein